MLKSKIIACLAAVVLLSACAPSADENLYDTLMDDLLPSPSIQTQEGEQRRLTVSSVGFDNPATNTLKNHTLAYMALHPDVLIALDILDPFDPDINSKLAAALMAGSAADIVSFYPDINTVQFMNEGYFADIYDLMRADAAFNKEDYFMNILSAVETDGKLFGLCTDFYPYSLFMMKNTFPEEFVSLFEESETLSYIDVLKMYVKMRGDAYLGDGVGLFEDYAPTNVFAFIYDDIIDFKNKTADFNTAEIRFLLEEAKTIPAPNVEYLPDYAILKSSYDTVKSFTDLINADYGYMLREFSASNVDLQALFPYEGRVFTRPRFLTSRNGGNLFSCGYLLAATNTCADKALAWDFLKFCISDKPEAYENVAELPYGYSYTVGNNPVNKKNYERACTIALEEQYRVGLENFNMQTAANRETVLADAKAFMMALPEKLNAPMSRYAGLEEIIWPDMYLYLTDKQSLDVTLTNMQSKVEIYLNE